MKELRLPLIKKWFDMTESGEKSEDYREINEYWFCRLCVSVNNIDVKSKHSYYILCNYLNDKMLSEVIKQIKFKEFTKNTLTHGYPAKGDNDKTLIFKHAGIHIGEGKPEWGAEKGKLYFVIKHGERIVQ